MNWWDIAPPFMYCVFHHISSHLPRQIWFWKISTKTWASVRPPPPLLGQKPKFFRKLILMAPLIHESYWPKLIVRMRRSECPVEIIPSCCWSNLRPLATATERRGVYYDLYLGNYDVGSYPCNCFLMRLNINQSRHHQTITGHWPVAKGPNVNQAGQGQLRI